MNYTYAAFKDWSKNVYGTVPVCEHDCAAKLKFLAGAEKPNDDNSTSWCVCVFIDEA